MSLELAAIEVAKGRAANQPALVEQSPGDERLGIDRRLVEPFIVI
ncbi:MAG: hypothetical protein ABIQ90_03220 [Polaromonas sp.]